MSAKYIKLILIVCLLLGLLACIVGCISAWPAIKKGLTQNIGSDAPLRSFKVTMDVNQQKELFTQLQKFADKHSLNLQIEFFNADKTLFLAETDGNGFHIIASNDTVAPREIQVSFNNVGSTPTPQATVDELINDLKSFISGIPSVTITEEK